MANVPTSLLEHFSPEPNTGCWIPVDGSPGNAYPWLRVDGRNVTAHRYALEVKLGRPLRRGRIACHVCPNKWYGNPGHIYEGTYSQNTSDAQRQQIPRLRAKLERLLADDRAMFDRAAGRPAPRPVPARALDKKRSPQRAQQGGSDVLGHGHSLPVPAPRS